MRVAADLKFVVVVVVVVVVVADNYFFEGQWVNCGANCCRAHFWFQLCPWSDVSQMDWKRCWRDCHTGFGLQCVNV